MNIVINIKQFKSQEPTLMLNPKTASALRLDRKIRGYVSYGPRKHFVDMVASEEVQENQVQLSQETADYLHIPLYCDFEVRVKGNEIALGPHVGVLVYSKDESITKYTLKSMLKYVPEYSKFHGSIIVFALDKADRSNFLVEGYCYNPKVQNWERGTFPYPSSMYLMTFLNQDWKNHFLSVIGDTMFNNYFLNKFKMYMYLSRDSSLKQYLPYTILYNSSQDIFDMLKLYGQVYVKPISGLQGKGVVKISLEDNMPVIRYREDDKNIVKTVDNTSESRETLEKLFDPEWYIVQEPIDILTYNGRVVDSRVVMQKDAYGKWVCKDVINRVGAEGSIVSNVYSGGEGMRAVDLFKKALNVSDGESISLKESISSLGTTICNSLDELGINYGVLGLDICIDKKGKLWLIEVNSRSPDPAIALDVDDYELYYDLIKAPQLYAKFLAGFGSDEGMHKNL